MSETSSLTCLCSGPWGSLLLIFILKSRDLAVVGTILTISAMAVDPFTQQIVQFYSCSTVVEGEPATVPYSNNYTTSSQDLSLDPILDPQHVPMDCVSLLASFRPSWATTIKFPPPPSPPRHPFIYSVEKICPKFTEVFLP